MSKVPKFNFNEEFYEETEQSSLPTSRKICKIIYTKNENIRLIKVNYRWLNHYTKNWLYNRSISSVKVDELYEEIKTNSNKICWTLHAFFNKSNNDVVDSIVKGFSRVTKLRFLFFIPIIFFTFKNP